MTQDQLIGVLQALYGLTMVAAAPLIFRATRLLGKPRWPWWAFSGAILGVALDRTRLGVMTIMGGEPTMSLGRTIMYLCIGFAILAAANGLQYFLRAWYDDRERRFRRSIWSSLAEVYLLDPETLEILDYNRGAEAQLPADDGRGSFTELLASPANDFLAALEPLQQGAARTVDVDVEVRGPEGPRLCQVTVQRTEGEERVAWVAFVTDNSQRREAEEEAQRQEARFRLITESVDEAILLADAEGQIRYESPKAGALLGYEPQARLGRQVLEQLTDEDRSWAVEEFLELVRGERDSLENQARFRRADDGRLVVLEYRARRVQFPGDDPSVLVSMRDVTQRVEAEVERRQEEERLRRRQARLVELAASEALREGDVPSMAQAVAQALVEELPVGRGSVWLMSPDGQSMESLALYLREGGPQEPAAILRAGDYPRYFQALANERTVDAHDAHTDPRTSEFSDGYLTQLGIGAMLDATIRVGGVGGVLCAEHLGGPRRWTHEDATFVVEMADLLALSVQEARSREAEKEKRHMAAQLRRSQRMETLGVMAGGIAHDFNNLLTPILGYADMALDEIPEEEREDSPLKEIRTAGERAQALVGQLLTFSRKVEAERKPLDLLDLLDEVLRLIRASLPSTIEIMKDLPSALPPVEGDSSQLHQVFLNLCANAGYAMKDGGGRLELALREVEVASPVSDDPLALQPGRYACITVSDTGAGMDEKTLERIFEPFFTTKPQGEGTGLGMAVTHGIVLGHGGDIRVESERGKGTRVTVRLPLSGQAPLPSAQQPVREEAPASEQVVIVVDDEPAVARFSARVLERAGCQVHMFNSPVEAAEAVESGEVTPDLLVTDQTMPGLTGLNLVDRLRQTLPHLPVILMSGYDAALDGSALDRARIEFFIRKPFKSVELVQAVRDLGDRDPAE